jgi:PAS domain S-box-containing protein
MKKNIKLLVIEDDEIDRMAFKRAAKSFHLNIESTLISGIEELKKALKQEAYDIIFTDYYLKDASAHDVLRESGEIPVIVATGSRDINIAVEILKDGAFDFLIKDFEGNYLAVLPFTIEKVLGKKETIDNEKMLSNVVNTILDSVFILDLSDNIVFVNPSFTKEFGFTAQEIIGMPVDILIPPKNRDENGMFDVDSMARDERLVRKNGDVFYTAMTVSALKNDSGQIISKIVVSRDISERIELIQETRSSQERLRTIFDNSSVGIVLFQLSGEIVQVNLMFKQLTGFTGTVLKQKNINELIHPEDREVDNDKYQDLIQGKLDTFNLERRLLHKEGHYIWTRKRISIVKNEQGEPQYLIAIIEDISDRKEIEKTLRDTEVRVEGIMQSMKDVIYSTNAKTGEVYYVNDAAELVFEIPASDFMDGLGNWRKLVHGGDLIKLELAHREIVEKGRVEVEYRILTPEGNVKWVRDRSWIIHDSDGQISRIDGVITDITLRKSAEQAHRDSEERYRTAIESSLEAIYMLNPLTERVLEVNHAFCELLGYSKQESLSLCIGDFVKHSAKSISDYITKIVDTGNSVLGERVWIRKDGKEVNVQVTATKISQREQEIIFVVARDITSEKRIKDALDQERMLLKEVISSAPIPMALFDEEMRFLVHSRSWLLSYGPPRTLLIGKNLFEVYPNLPSNWPELCQRGLQGEILNISEQDYKLPSGDLMYLRLAIRPWGDKDNKTSGIVLVAERIDELVSARKEAEEANQAKSVFLARITHELRTPLNAILGYSQIMAKDKSIADNHKLYIDSMYRSGIHLLNMINDILDLSKIEASRMELQNDEFDLRLVINDIHEMFRLKAIEKGLTLDVILSEDVHPYVEGDRSKLNQVLINLLGNAVKFTDKGSVSLKIEVKTLDNALEKQLLSFVVNDTGIGIPQEDIIKIFEPFHQAKNSISQGTGLGLSITSRIVTLMGGQIEVSSKLGLGSTFDLKIPLKKLDTIAKEASNMFSKVESILSPKPFRILVVDDVEHNRQVVGLLMERLGAHVTEANNGLEAVESFEEINPHLIIMDIIMPVMDGVKAMRLIKKHKKGKDIPIIALTASGFDDKRDKLIAAGFTDYILKPFVEENLLESIHKHCDIEFEFENKAIGTTVNASEVPIDQLASEIKKLPNKIQVNFIECLELQDYDGILAIIQKDEDLFTEAFISKLTNAVNNFDIYLITRLAKSSRE